MKRHFKGGWIVDVERKSIRLQDIYVDGDRIVDAGAAASGEWEEVDCRGRTIAPGFIDLYAELPDLERDEKCAIAGGFSRVVLDSASPIIIDDPTKVRELKRRLQNVSVDVHIAGATTEGLRGEALAEMGGMLFQGCTVLSSGRTLVEDSLLLRNILAYAARFGRPVFTRAGEASWENGGVVREGQRSVLLGLPGIPTESEEVGLARLSAAVRLTGASVHVTRVWSRRGVEMLRRAKAEGLPITGSVTAHHLTISDALIEEHAYMGSTRWLPPLGSPDDREALLEALRDGTLDAVATDHRPLQPHRQMLEMQIADSGSVGLQTALPLLLEATGSLVECCRYLSQGPARVIGVDAPSLLPGSKAEFSVIDPEKDWVVSESTLHSRSNTPLLGKTLRGWVDGMMIDGKYLSA